MNDSLTNAKTRRRDARYRAAVVIQSAIRGFLCRGAQADKYRILLLKALRDWANGNILKLDKRKDLADRNSQALLLVSIKYATKPSRPLKDLAPAKKVRAYIKSIQEKRKQLEIVNEIAKTEYLNRRNERNAMILEDKWSVFRVRFDNVLRALLEEDALKKREAIERERLEAIKRQVYVANKNVIENYEEEAIRERQEREAMFRNEYVQHRVEDEIKKLNAEVKQRDREIMTWEDGMGHKRREAELSEYNHALSVIESKERIKLAKVESETHAALNPSALSGTSLSASIGTKRLGVTIRQRNQQQMKLKAAMERTVDCLELASCLIQSDPNSTGSMISSIDTGLFATNITSLPRDGRDRAAVLTQPLYRFHGVNDVNNFICALYEYMCHSKYRCWRGFDWRGQCSEVLQGKTLLKHTSILPKGLHLNEKAVAVRQAYDVMLSKHYWWREGGGYEQEGTSFKEVHTLGGTLSSTVSLFKASGSKLIGSGKNQTNGFDTLRLATAFAPIAANISYDKELLFKCREVRLVATVLCNNKQEKLPPVEFIEDGIDAYYQEKLYQRKKRYFKYHTTSNTPLSLIPKKLTTVAVWCTISSENRAVKEKINMLRLLCRQKDRCFHLLAEAIAVFDRTHAELSSIVRELRVSKVQTRTMRLAKQSNAINLELKLPNIRRRVIEFSRLLRTLVFLNYFAYIDLLGLIIETPSRSKFSQTPDTSSASASVAATGGKDFRKFQFAGTSVLNDDSSEDEFDGRIRKPKKELVIEEETVSVTDRLTADNAKVVDLKAVLKSSKSAARSSVHSKQNRGAHYHNRGAHGHRTHNNGSHGTPVGSEAHGTGKSSSKHNEKGAVVSSSTPAKVSRESASGIEQSAEYAYIPVSLHLPECPTETSEDVEPLPPDLLAEAEADARRKRNKEKGKPKHSKYVFTHIPPAKKEVVVNVDVDITHSAKGNKFSFRATKPESPSEKKMMHQSFASLSGVVDHHFVDITNENDDSLSPIKIVEEVEKIYVPVLYGVYGCGHYNMEHADQYDFIQWGKKIMRWYKDVQRTWFQKYEDEWKKYNLATCLSYIHKYRWYMHNLIVSNDVVHKDSDSAAALNYNKKKHEVEQNESKYKINPNDAELTRLILHKSHLCDLLDIVTSQTDITMQFYEPSTQAVWSKVISGYEADIYFGKHPASMISRYLYRKEVPNDRVKLIKSPPNKHSRGQSRHSASSDEKRSLQDSREKQGSRGQSVPDREGRKTTSGDDPENIFPNTDPPGADGLEIVESSLTGRESHSVYFGKLNIFDKLHDHPQEFPGMFETITKAELDSWHECSFILDRATHSYHNGEDDMKVSRGDTGQSAPPSSHQEKHRSPRRSTPHSKRFRRALQSHGVPSDINMEVHAEEYERIKHVNPVLIRCCDSLWCCDLSKNGTKAALERPQGLDVDMDTNHYDSNLLMKFEAKAMERERSELLKMAEAIINQKKCIQLYETASPIDNNVKETNPVDAKESGNTMAVRRDRNSRGDANSRGGTPVNERNLSRGGAISSSSKRSTPNSSNKRKVESVKNPTEIDDHSGKRKYYRLRIDKMNTNPGKFISSHKTLDTWECIVPCWMQPAYHWGTLCPPEPFWRKLLLELKFKVDDGEGKYAKLDVLNRKIDGMARKLAYNLKSKLYTSKMKLEMTQEVRFQEKDRESMEYEDAYSVAMRVDFNIAEEKARIRKKNFPMRLLHFIGSAVCMPFVSAPAAQVGLGLPQKNPKDMTPEEILAQKALELEMQELRRKQNALIRKPAPSQIIDWDGMLRHFYKNKKYMTLTHEQQQEIHRNALRLDYCNEMDRKLKEEQMQIGGGTELQEGGKNSASKTPFRSYVADWVTGDVDGKASKKKTNSRLAKVSKNCDGDSDDSDDETTTTNENAENRKFSPRPKEGWLCGGISSIVSVNRCVSNGAVYPRGEHIVNVFYGGNMDKLLEWNEFSIEGARVGHLNRPLCENNMKMFARVKTVSGRLLGHERMYRHLSTEEPDCEIARLRVLNKTMLWNSVVNARYSHTSHKAIAKLQSYVRMRRLRHVVAEKRDAKVQAALRREKGEALGALRMNQRHDPLSTRQSFHGSRRRRIENTEGLKRSRDNEKSISMRLGRAMSYLTGADHDSEKSRSRPRDSENSISMRVGRAMSYLTGADHDSEKSRSRPRDSENSISMRVGRAMSYLTGADHDSEKSRSRPRDSENSISMRVGRAISYLTGADHDSDD